MSHPDQPPAGPSRRPGVTPDLDDARLLAALSAAGLNKGDARKAVAVVRAELRDAADTRTDAPTEVEHPDRIGHFRTLADLAPQLVWHSANEGCWIWASPNWLSYTGQSQGESRGQGWLDAIHPDDRDVTMQAWHAAPERGSLDVQHRIRRSLDGAWRMHQTRSAPLRGRPDSGEQLPPASEWIGASTDIEDHKRWEKEQRTLLLELQHRTRNLLAIVQAIAYRSLSPTLDRANFAARLASLGRVQGFLARTAAWSVPLRDLVEAELRALADGGEG